MALIRSVLLFLNNTNFLQYLLLEAVVQFKDNLFENSVLSVRYFMTDNDLSGTWQLRGNDVVTPSCIT